MLPYNWNEPIEWIGSVVLNTRGQVISLGGDVDRSRFLLEDYISAYRFAVFHLSRERYLQIYPNRRVMLYPNGSPIQLSTRGPFVIVKVQYFFYAVAVLEHIIYINKWRLNYNSLCAYAQRSSSSTMTRCPNCGKEVYFAERVTSLGKDWHRPCLKCAECNKTLSAGQHSEIINGDNFRLPLFGFTNLHLWLKRYELNFPSLNMLAIEIDIL
ncbi:hypothetical protein ACTXT7_014442 [Hymenolepis weldensis]